MKKILIGLFAFLFITIAGCKYNDVNQSTTYTNTTSSRMQSSFNQETYVWENWLFNTNSTSRTIK